MGYTENDFRELLLKYVNEEMDNIIPEQMPGYNHKYSRRYKKRLRKMMWSEKYFGKHLNVGYVLRRIAVFVLIILSLYAASEVSAKVFSINPWKAIVSFFSENEVNYKMYRELDTEKVLNAKAVVRDIPAYVPEGYEMETVTDDIRLHIVWHNESAKENIVYTRNVIEPDMVVIEDATPELVDEVTIAGYIGYCYTDEDRTWIQWEDIEYRHQIEMSDESYLEDIVMMANCLYE